MQKEESPLPLDLNPPNKAISQNLNQNNPRVSANLESRPLRGAKNRIQGCSSATADFLLEADKRGSPPKSEKRQLLGTHFKKVGGSGAGGGAALLREETRELNKQKSDNFAESTLDSAVDCHADSANLRGNDDSFLDSSPTAQNDKILQFRRI